MDDLTDRERFALRAALMALNTRAGQVELMHALEGHNDPTNPVSLGQTYGLLDRLSNR